MQPRQSLVLAGAIAQGAYEAGVLAELAARDVPISVVAGSSAGALNGLMYASGVRSGRGREACERLCQLWIEQASLARLVATSLSVRGIAARRGALDTRHVIGLLRRNIAPCRTKVRHSVEFRCVVSPLDGVEVDGRRTFEHVEVFRDDDFDDPERLETMFRFVAASAALPGMFEPVELPGLGPCIDGGAVNNTPVSHTDAGRVFVVSAFPELPPTGHRGVRLIEHIVNILINERVFRDLERDCAGHVVEIRPRTALAGNAFSAFLSRRLRRQYCDAGRARARHILDRALNAPAARARAAPAPASPCLVSVDGR